MTEDPSLIWSLYKAGHLIPAIIVAAFLGLKFLEGKIAWLRVGYRKLAVVSVLAGLGMLIESAARGTTPNIAMLMGALGAALTAWMKTEGEPKAAPPAVS